MKKYPFVVQLTLSIAIRGNTVEEAKDTLRRMEWDEVVKKSDFIMDSEVQTEEEYENG